MMQVHLSDQVVGQQDLLVSLDAVQRRLPNPQLDVRQSRQQKRLPQPILHQIPMAVARDAAIAPDGGQQTQLPMIGSIGNSSRCKPLHIRRWHVAPDPILQQQTRKPGGGLRGRSRSGTSKSEPGM